MVVFMKRQQLAAAALGVLAALTLLFVIWEKDCLPNKRPQRQQQHRFPDRHTVPL